jgi:predicted Zn-dependent protease
MRRLLASVALSFLTLIPVTALAGQKKKNPMDDPSRIGRRDVNKQSLNLYSRRRAIEMGRQMARQIEDLVTLYDDPSTETYVQRLTDRIVRHSDAKIPVRVEVILSPEVDAFALPGGHLFVTTGLILKAHNEAELAGVIAHEVAHIADRDATRKMTEQKVWNWISLPVLIVGGPAAFTLQQGVAGPLAMIVFSRAAERRADNLGLQYLYESGYDPEGFIDFFERARRLEKDPDGGIAAAFSSHPLTRDRVAAAEREIERDLPPRRQYVVTTSAFQHVKAGLEQYMRDEMPLVPATPKKPVLRNRSKAKHFRPEDLP